MQCLQQTLMNRQQSERYLIGFNNMKVNYNSTAQCLHNCSYQVNNTAGYILFMGISAPLPATSTSNQHVLDTKVNNILLNRILTLCSHCTVWRKDTFLTTTTVHPGRGSQLGAHGDTGMMELVWQTE